jgi:hypothetical protein
MTILALASALLALLPAVAGEAPLEQTSGECTASSMRVELLQKSLGAPAIALTEADDLHPSTLRFNALTKSTFALSSSHTGKSLAFKRFFFPVMTEEEFGGNERSDFSTLVQDAIGKGAALPDDSEHPASSFDDVAGHEACGKTARVRLATVLGESDYHTLSEFHFHGVFADAYHGSAESREVGGLTVRDVERIFQEELGDLTEYSPWMDIHVAIYDNDLDSYAHRFLDHSVPVLALRWPSADENLPSHFYSLIVHAPDTQEVFEIISTTAPSDTRLIVRDFPMTRHVFQEEELVPLTHSSGPTQLHISRTHYDLDAVKAHYQQFFHIDPIYEVRDAKTGVGFVSFWHQTASFPGQERDQIRVQVMYWNRPNQSMTVAHTTAWLDRRLEHINSQYMRSYKSCWPIWGDNHYTVSSVPMIYFQQVQDKYDDAGLGYMLFRKDDVTFTGYFPMPGGMYLELQVLGDLPAPEGVRHWKPRNEEGHYALYCWEFTCPP